jgi:2,4-dienoyl-CoA reductase-like NADH-dependent reductase (Old Yellow Enzyme family)
MNKFPSSLQIGHLHVTNRIVMAPMTRGRNDSSGRVGLSTAQYYSSCAGAGSIGRGRIRHRVPGGAEHAGHLRRPVVEAL